MTFSCIVDTTKDKIIIIEKFTSSFEQGGFAPCLPGGPLLLLHLCLHPGCVHGGRRGGRRGGAADDIHA